MRVKRKAVSPVPFRTFSLFSFPYAKFMLKSLQWNLNYYQG